MYQLMQWNKQIKGMLGVDQQFLIFVWRTSRPQRHKCVKSIRRYVYSKNDAVASCTMDVVSQMYVNIGLSHSTGVFIKFFTHGISLPISLSYSSYLMNRHIVCLSFSETKRGQGKYNQQNWNKGTKIEIHVAMYDILLSFSVFAKYDAWLR